MNSSSSDAPPKGDWLSSMMGWNSTQGMPGFNEHIDFEVQPREFTPFAAADGPIAGVSTASCFKVGGAFRATGKTWMPVTFHQKKIRRRSVSSANSLPRRGVDLIGQAITANRSLAMNGSSKSTSSRDSRRRACWALCGW